MQSDDLGNCPPTARSLIAMTLMIKLHLLLTATDINDYTNYFKREENDLPAFSPYVSACFLAKS